MTTAMAIVLAVAFASVGISAFWLVANYEMKRMLEIIADLSFRNAELRKRLNKLERYELTESTNPPDWWMTRTE